MPSGVPKATQRLLGCNANNAQRDFVVKSATMLPVDDSQIRTVVDTPFFLYSIFVPPMSELSDDMALGLNVTFSSWIRRTVSLPVSTLTILDPMAQVLLSREKLDESQKALSGILNRDTALAVLKSQLASQYSRVPRLVPGTSGAS